MNSELPIAGGDIRADSSPGEPNQPCGWCGNFSLIGPYCEIAISPGDSLEPESRIANPFEALIGGAIMTGDSRQGPWQPHRHRSYEKQQRAKERSRRDEDSFLLPASHSTNDQP